MMVTSRRALILVASCVVVWSASALGQSAKAIPRLADGKPDMQGYWTNQTFTPLERPAQFKDKAVFTAEEAEAFAKRALDDVKDVPRGDQVKSDADIHYDDGIWLLEHYEKGAMLRTSIITDPADGRIPPLSAEGQKRAQARAEARKLHWPVRQRAGPRPLRALHLLGARRAAASADRLQLEPHDRAGPGCVRHPT